jgi:hypothetical protein
MNLLKTFKKDLEIAVKNDMKSKTTISQLFVFGMLVFSYTHLVPLLRYYKDRENRINKINKLKAEGKFVI